MSPCINGVKAPCLFLLLLGLVLATSLIDAALVEHHLVSTYTVVNTEKGPLFMSCFNDTVPGPSIIVKRGDTLRVTVTNSFSVEPLSIHWHGFQLRNAVHNDGVVGVTQAPILPGQTMVYEFVVEEVAGTYWYHSQAGLDRVAVRGLYGSLVVLPADTELDNHHGMYDEDNTLTFGDMLPTPSYTEFVENMGSLLKTTTATYGQVVAGSTYHTGHVNGNSMHTHVVEVTGGLHHRLRLINVGEVFGYQVCVDKHTLTVIAADGADVQPFETDCVQLHVGERFDVVLHATQPASSYWIRFIPGLNTDQYDVEMKAILRYVGAPAAPPTTERPSRDALKVVNCFDNVFSVHSDPTHCLPLTALRRLSTAPQLLATVPSAITHRVAFAFTPPPQFGHFIQVTDEVQGTTTPVTQTGMSSLPLLYHGLQGQHVHPHATVISLEHNQLVVMVLENHAQNTRFTQPIHIHGHKFHILDIQYSQDNCRSTFCPHLDPDVTTFLDPSVAPLKDTVILPDGGYVVVAFRADNPGLWAGHSQVVKRSENGMMFTLVEARERIPYFGNASMFPSNFPLGNDTSSLATSPLQESMVACDCLENRDASFGQSTHATWKCSNAWLCRHTMPPTNGLAVHPDVEREGRIRFGKYRDPTPHAVFTVLALVIVLGTIFAVRRFSEKEPTTVTTSLGEAGASCSTPVVSSSCTMAWSNVCVTAKAGAPQLLNSISGYATPGTVTAIVGPLACGKSVLFHLLAGRVDRLAWASGSVTLNGRALDAIPVHERAGLVSFMGATDSFQGTQTVHHLMHYYGALLSPMDWTPAQIDARINMLVSKMGIEPLRQRLCMTLNAKQAHQVKLAVQLLFPSPVVLLDDLLVGTSDGHDEALIQFVVQVAREAKATVVCTLSSLESSTLVEYFDRVFTMEAGGLPSTRLEAAEGSEALTLPKAQADELLAIMQAPDTFAFAPRHKPFWAQVGLLVRHYIKTEARVALDMYKGTVAIGLGIVTGLIWLKVGVENTRLAYSETISLMFAAMITWVIAYVYPTAAGVERSIKLLRLEVSQGLYSFGTRSTVWMLLDFFTLSLWPFVYGVITFSLAYVGVSWTDNLAKSVILCITATVFQGVGLVLGSAVKDSRAAVAIGTIVVQAMLMMAGFYRTLPSGVGWLPKVVGLPYYILTALLRAEFSSSDSYECVPSFAASALGPYHCSLETNIVTQDFRGRGVEFVNSSNDPRAWSVVWPLILFFFIIRGLAAVILRYRVWNKLKTKCQGRESSQRNGSSFQRGISHTRTEADYNDGCDCCDCGSQQCQCWKVKSRAYMEQHNDGNPAATHVSTEEIESAVSHV
eukprot:m.54112 g.54112  ORF g.54112 m.54112 type:complete len:1330 (-) comp11395_c0_seq1:163-4152(-)